MDSGDLWTFGAAFVEQVYAHYDGLRDDGLLGRSGLHFNRLGPALTVFAL